VEDISSSKPDSIQWAFDPATLLLGSDSSGPMIRYAQPGTYPATMLAFYGGCDFSVSQHIVIQPYDSNSYNPMAAAGMSFDSVLLSPNPNNGTFNIYVRLYMAQPLVMTVTTISGQLVFTREWNGQQLITGQVTLPGNIVSGVYIAELVTATGIRDYNIIVAK
jgi:hypothetical protein